MKKRINIIFIILIIATIPSCSLPKKKHAENELILGVPANDFAINKSKTEDIIVEERQDRVFEDLPIDDTEVVLIEEKTYLTKIANIKAKIDEYKDKIIVVEGMYATYSSWDDTFKASLVYRNGPNDFNNDIWGGFFLNDLKGQDLKIDDWIRVIGKPYVFTTKDSEGTDYEYLYLDVQEIQILPEKERGIELVNN